MKTNEQDAHHPLDIALGSRIRLRRRELGLSQEQLAKQIGITFQQVQKYEHGANRVSFSRLVDIAHALKCSTHDLIGDLDAPAASQAMFDAHVERLNEPGAAELLEAFCAIASPKQRRAVLGLAKQLSSATFAEQDEAA
jgi:transcriptional regulator with XRE-family HTH domain